MFRTQELDSLGATTRTYLGAGAAGAARFEEPVDPRSSRLLLRESPRREGLRAALFRVGAGSYERTPPAARYPVCRPPPVDPERRASFRFVEPVHLEGPDRVDLVVREGAGATVDRLEGLLPARLPGALPRLTLDREEAWGALEDADERGDEERELLLEGARRPALGREADRLDRSENDLEGDDARERDAEPDLTLEELFDFAPVLRPRGASAGLASMTMSAAATVRATVVLAIFLIAALLPGHGSRKFSRA